MNFNILDLGRKIVNTISVFGLHRLINVWEKHNLEEVLTKTEAFVYDGNGLEGFEKGSHSEVDRLSRRSFAQFMATRSMYKFVWVSSFQEILFFLFLIIYVVSLPFYSLFCSKKKVQGAKPIVIFYHYQYLLNLVKDLYNDDDKIFIEKAPIYFSLRDLHFIVHMLTIYPRIILFPHFLFSIVKWVSMYSGIIRVYQPKAIINFIEGSFVSSILTCYLRENKIKHINHMHGEVFSSPRIAFSEFDLFIVYGAYWEKLYRSLKCKAVFIISKNSVYKHLYQINTNKSQSNNYNSLLILHSQLLKTRSHEYEKLCKLLLLVPANWAIRFRCHPNEKKSGMKCFETLKEDFKRSDRHITIDEYQNDSIESSLACTTVAVGRISVALMQAWVAGCKVIYLEETNDLRQRYIGTANVLFIDSNKSDEEIRNFFVTPYVRTPNETSWIDYVTKII